MVHEEGLTNFIWGMEAGLRKKLEFDLHTETLKSEDFDGTEESNC